MQKVFLLMMFTIFIFSDLTAQDRIVSGLVQNESGKSLIGATVRESGTTNGTVTDKNGHYSLKLSPKDSVYLVFTYTGYKTARIAVQGRRRINVKLSTDVKQLDDMVVVGYGSVKKKDLTGAVSIVNVEEMGKSPISNLAQALTGRASGVQVHTSEGAPGAPISIKIRGGGSITQSNEPLYIVDGSAVNDLSMLDPTDIASITILKDASSTAIYGARGSNGVVVIKTKTGKPGRTQVTYHGYVSYKWLANKYDLLNPLDFVKLEYERMLNDESLRSKFFERYGEWSELDRLYGNRPGIDWQDEMFEPTFHRYHKIGISGGSQNTTYYATVSHDNNHGQMIESGFKRNQAILRLKQKINKKLTASVKIRYTDQKVFGMSTSEQVTGFNKLRQILQYRPTIGKKGRDADLLTSFIDPALGELTGRVSVNPLMSAKAERRDRIYKVINLNGELDYHIIHNLTYSLRYGYNFYDQQRKYFNGEHSVSAYRSGGPNGYLQNTKRFTWNYTNLLKYKLTVNQDHDLDFLLGQEERHVKREWFRAGTNQFANDDIGLANLSLGKLPDLPESHVEDNRLLSFFGRVNYNFKDKWLVTGTLRADGSSKFGSGNKYGLFPSVAVAWRLIKEPFIEKLHFFDNLKLRLSYGAAGNNRIPNYRSLAMMSSGYYPLNNVPTISAWPSVLPDPNLQWETTISRNIGLDVSFINGGRIQLHIEAYKNTTKDLLLSAQIPYTSGYASIIENVGKTQNKGLEISINTVNIDQENFQWSTDFNISFNKNKVLALAGEDFFLRSSGWTRQKANDFMVKVGEPLGLMYGYVTEGLYQVNEFNYDPATNNYMLKEGIPYDPNWMPQPGYWKFKDVSGPEGKPDGKITPEDRTIIGNANPKFYGGMTNVFVYRNFDLSLFFDFTYGSDIYNANKLYYTLTSSRYRNQLALVKNRWTTIDKNGQVITDPKQLTTVNKGKKIPSWIGAGSTYPILHSWSIEDGSFLRLNTISLGYTLQGNLLDRLSINKFRLYATLHNIAIITNYSGYDPDVGTRGNSLTPNVDWGAYPRSRSFVFGINLSF